MTVTAAVLASSDKGAQKRHLAKWLGTEGQSSSTFCLFGVDALER